MNVRTDDVTFPWGQSANPMENQTGQWRLAIYEDIQESIDGNKLYCLYEPQTEHEAGVNAKAGEKCLAVFDMNIRCFAYPIWLRDANGRAKFLFSLKCPSSDGGSALILVTETQTYEGQTRLHFWRLDLNRDGNAVVSCRPISDVSGVGGDYIVSMREDTPEVVVMFNPGLQVCTVDCMTEYPIAPQSFSIPGAELTHFYDGFLNGGRVYLLSASPDGHLDYSRVHVLNLQSRQVNTHQCLGDPSRGFPPARKQAAIDSVPGYILLAGGEVSDGGNVHRLVDYWVLNCERFEWTQIPAQMPCPLIEPRLTACNSGNVYLWGDYDVPLPGMPQTGTHLRILKIAGMENYKTPPPSYNQSAAHPVPSAYPSIPAQNPPPYPSYQPATGGYPAQPGGGYGQQPPVQPQHYGGSQQPPSYGMQPSQPTSGSVDYNPYPQANYPRQDYGGQQQPGYISPDAGYQQPSGTTPYYPPQEKKKDCSLM